LNHRELNALTIDILGLLYPSLQPPPWIHQPVDETGAHQGQAYVRIGWRQIVTINDGERLRKYIPAGPNHFLVACGYDDPEDMGKLVTIHPNDIKKMYYEPFQQTINFPYGTFFQRLLEQLRSLQQTIENSQ